MTGPDTAVSLGRIAESLERIEHGLQVGKCEMIFPVQITLHVDFPALDNLVSFLRENNQAKIDAAAAQVEELTVALAKSQTQLKDSEATKP